METKNDIIFKSYNEAIKQGYDEAFRNKREEEILRMSQEQVSQYLTEGLKVWANLPIEEIGGLTPREYFNRITTLEELIKLFTLGSKICDDTLPEVFLDKLKTYGEKAIDALIELAANKLIISNQEEFYISIMAIRILGKWKVERAVSTFINILLGSSREQELIAEEVVEALSNIGVPCVEHIIHILENSQTINYGSEYLFMTLTGIGVKNRSDRIYRCLKNTFIKMDNKVVGAMCIGDYGDGRAIPMLRGYVEKNANNINHETFCEIKAAIKRLGGTIEDIMK